MYRVFWFRVDSVTVESTERSTAIKYARENNVPFLGLCLGMQLSIVEYARHICGLEDAHSIELDPNTTASGYCI